MYLKHIFKCVPKHLKRKKDSFCLVAHFCFQRGKKTIRPCEKEIDSQGVTKRSRGNKKRTGVCRVARGMKCRNNTCTFIFLNYDIRRYFQTKIYDEIISGGTGKMRNVTECATAKIINI